jgi:hypothetical protein
MLPETEMPGVFTAGLIKFGFGSEIPDSVAWTRPYPHINGMVTKALEFIAQD